MKVPAKPIRPGRKTWPPEGAPVRSLILEEELAAGSMTVLERRRLGLWKLEHRLGRDSFWTLLTTEDGGGLALRMACWQGGGEASAKRRSQGWDIHCPLGLYTVVIHAQEEERTLLRWTTTFTPVTDLLPTVSPRDVYVLGTGGAPSWARGEVKAAQRGLNSGLVFFTVEAEAALGAGLYFQNLTALNPYFEALGTRPDGVVGGVWPEIGYQPPNSPAIYGDAAHPLRGGEAVVVSDAYLALSPRRPPNCKESGRLFLTLLGDIYRRLDKPTPDHRDWPARAEQTLQDLRRSPKATIRHYGDLYVHPYTASEYPDVMVQLAVLTAMSRYSRWRGRAHPLEAELAAGLSRFHHRPLGMLRRYLPNVGKDKDRDAVDSWYLYHPLMNLGRLAQGGHEEARKLFKATVGYAVKAARHFRYAWPVQYKARDFSIITAERNETGLGQTDVGGLYAYVMIQAYEITGDRTYLDEARGALSAIKGLGFELNYQANVTAWGAAACISLGRLLDDTTYLDLAHTFLASFFHNCLIWESEIGNAKHFKNFLGATCLQDAPYMAIYECYESVAAFDEILKADVPGLSSGARMLMAEYRRFALDRSWSFYPDALPEDMLATDIRNGHIDRELSFPLEDLYADGQPAGQVGQEIYGCGAAFVFASIAFHRMDGMPFQLFCDYPAEVEQIGEREVGVAVYGPDDCPCALRVVDAPEGARISVRMDDEPLEAKRRQDHRQYVVQPGRRITVSWCV